MPISETIPSIINGVSQQPATQRLLSQCEAQDDCLDTISQGKIKRPPTELIKAINTTYSGSADPLIHFIDWGGTAQYWLLVDNGSIRMFDMAGVEKTVNLGTGAATYLTLVGSETKPSKNMRALNFADKTLLLNKTVLTDTLRTDLSPNDKVISVGVYDFQSGKDPVFVYLRQTNYSTDYRIDVTVNNANYTVTKTTSPTLASDITNHKILKDLGDALIAAIPATDIIIQYDGNGLFISAPGINAISGLAQDLGLKVSVSSSNDNGDLQAVGAIVQEFTDLPTWYVVPALGRPIIHKIVGKDASFTVPYYVKFIPHRTPHFSVDPSQYFQTFTSGYWVECQAPEASAVTGLSPSLMPYQILPKGDGTFDIKQVTWNPRNVGDATKPSCPAPSFTGLAIQDLFYFKGRLGFIAGQNCVMSGANDPFDFFRTTVTTLIDSDVLDIQIVHPKASLFRSAVVFQSMLLLFTDKTQFNINTESLLTARNIGASQVAEYECSPICKPITLGTSVFAPFTRGGYSGLREFTGLTNRIPTVDVSISAADVSAHVPSYIPGEITQMVGCTNENTIAIQANGDERHFWLYRFFKNGEENIQASFSRFQASGGKIFGMSFVGSDLYIVMSVTTVDHGFESSHTGLYFVKMALSLNNFDPFTVAAGNPHITNIDRRIKDTDCSSVSYNATSDLTTFTLPYYTSAAGTPAMEVVGRQANTPNLTDGKRYTVVSVNNLLVRVQGDLTGIPVWIGEKYNGHWIPSTQYLRSQSQNGSVISEGGGRLQIKRMSALYNDSGYFTVVVTPSHRDPMTKSFVASRYSDSFTLGSLSKRTGRFDFSVNSKNDQVVIEFSNDSPLESKWQSLEYIAEYFNPARKG